VPGLTILTVPHFFHAGQSSTSFAEPLLMFMATAPPRLDPTTTWGRCRSNSVWAMRTASLKSSSGSLGLMTSWPCWARKVGLAPPGIEFQPWRKRISLRGLDLLRQIACERVGYSRRLWSTRRRGSGHFIGLAFCGPSLWAPDRRTFGKTVKYQVGARIVLCVRYLQRG
jgi:hypothetical protein